MLASTAEALLAPIAVAVTFAVFRTDIFGLLGPGSSLPCEVGYEAAGTAALLYHAAVTRTTLTVVIRTDQLPDRNPDLCWAFWCGVKPLLKSAI